MPILPFDLFRIPLFSLSVGTSVCSYAAQIVAYVSLPFLFETGLHLSAVKTGLLLTPWPFMTAITVSIAGRLTIRYPASVRWVSFVDLNFVEGDPAEHIAADQHDRQDIAFLTSCAYKRSYDDVRRH
jgi:hypothetical protein